MRMPLWRDRTQREGGTMTADERRNRNLATHAEAMAMVRSLYAAARDNLPADIKRDAGPSLARVRRGLAELLAVANASYFTCPVCGLHDTAPGRCFNGCTDDGRRVDLLPR